MIEAVVISGLSSFAITYIVKFTRGPFDIFRKFRRYIGLEIPIISYDAVNKREVEEWGEDDDPEGFIALMVKCFWCLTTWVSLLVVIGYYLFSGLNSSTFLALNEFLFIWWATIGLSGLLFFIGDR